MSRATRWTLACPCLPVFEVDISTILQGRFWEDLSYAMAAKLDFLNLSAEAAFKPHANRKSQNKDIWDTNYAPTYFVSSKKQVK